MLTWQDVLVDVEGAFYRAALWVSSLWRDDSGYSDRDPLASPDDRSTAPR